MDGSVEFCSQLDRAHLSRDQFQQVLHVYFTVRNQQPIRSLRLISSKLSIYVKSQSFVNLHNVTSSLAVSVNAIYCCQYQLLLQMTKTHYIFQRFLCFYLRITRDYTQTGARCIQQAPVELLKHVWQLSSILARYYTISYAQTMHISIQRF